MVKLSQRELNWGQDADWKTAKLLDDDDADDDDGDDGDDSDDDDDDVDDVDHHHHGDDDDDHHHHGDDGVDDNHNDDWEILYFRLGPSNKLTYWLKSSCRVFCFSRGAISCLV